MHAAERGYAEIVDLLTKIPGIDPNLTDVRGDTALHLACRGNHTVVVDRLLDLAGIRADITNKAGQTPRDVAAQAVQHRLLSAEKKEMSVEWNQTGRVGEAMAGDTFGVVSPAMWEDTPVSARWVTSAAEATELLHDALRTRRHRHKNILRIYGLSEQGTGQLVLLMEYAQQGNLRDFVLARAGRLSPRDKLRIGTEIAEAVGFLHAQRPPVIHRALRPESVLIMADGSVRISDFGTARAKRGSSFLARLFGGRYPVAAEGTAFPERADANNFACSCGSSCLSPTQPAMRPTFPTITRKLRRIQSQC